MKKIIPLFLSLVVIISIFAPNALADTQKTIYIGDVNEDGFVNAADRTLLARYLANWEGVTINEKAADINGDGQVTAADRTLLARYLANWEGYDQYFGKPIKDGNISVDQGNGWVNGWY